MDKGTRVRFAPSPTGFLHVGGLRTALYNYLFARKMGGKLILRIEDTDRTRLVANAVDNLIDSLHWAGLEYDEGPQVGGDFGPYYQSERLGIYAEQIKTLIANETGYYAFDSAEEIEEFRKRQSALGMESKYDKRSMRNQFSLGNEKTKELLDAGTPYVIRLNVPESVDVTFEDIIRGTITVNTKEIDDQVLMKSDGFPTYHFANVVDDHFMQITHVIRGEEWLPSTPKHVLLYEAFGWEKPQFAHLPLLLNKDKTKLSKRQGSVAVEDFRAQGYLKEAFVNFVALLGWNPTADREIYDITELEQLFNLAKVNKGGAVFDLQKLTWMNAHYLRNMPPANLIPFLIMELKKAGYGSFDDNYLEQVIVLLRERVEFVRQFAEFAPYMFTEQFEYDKDYTAKCRIEEVRPLVIDLLEIYRQSDDFSHANIHEATKTYLESKSVKLKLVIHPLRLMLTGCNAGAGMFETMEVLGKERCIQRIERFLKSH
jgi:glutamyl-tRNA synthetase